MAVPIKNIQNRSNNLLNYLNNKRNNKPTTKRTPLKPLTVMRSTTPITPLSPITATKVNSGPSGEHSATKMGNYRSGHLVRVKPATNLNSAAQTATIQTLPMLTSAGSITRRNRRSGRRGMSRRRN